MSLQKNEQNADLHINEDCEVPPDGGRRAWAVLVAAFICNGVTWGVINSYGVIYRELDTQLKKERVANSESKAALPGALSVGLMYLLSALAGLASALLGLRATAVLGGGFIVLSLILSSFVVHNITLFYFTYGLLYGLGASLAYIPAIAILSHYFKKYLGLANGIVTVGESFFTVILPFLMQYMVDQYGLDRLFSVLAVLALSIALGGLVYKPMPSLVFRIAPGHNRSCKSILDSTFNFQLWKNMRYRVWCASMALGLIGNFVPFVHLAKLIEVTFPDRQDYYTNVPIQCYEATSAIGRLLYGFLSDFPNIDAIQLQQIAFYGLGSLTIIIPLVKSFALIVVISLGMGIFDGAIVALTGPVVTEICGVADAPYGLGFMFGLTAIPLSFGPPFAGYLFSLTNSYVLPFLLAGIWPLIGASLMFVIRYPRFGCCGRKLEARVQIKR